MGELEQDETFVDIQARLADILKPDSAAVSLAFDTKRITPAKFLEARFAREQAVLLQIGETRVIEIASFCLSATGAILNPPVRDLKFSQIFALCVYYDLLGRCCARARAGAPEIIDEQIAQEIIRQATIVTGVISGLTRSRCGASFRGCCPRSAPGRA
jgi:hypothetical protein